MKVIDKLELCRKLELEGNPIQDRFLLSPARFKIFRAARRVGKSFTAAKDVFPDVLTPGTRGWIVGPTYDLADKEFRYIHDFLIRANRKLGLPLPVKVRANPKAGDLYIRTAWGSEVIGKTADNPQSLVGEELDWIIMSEAASHNADTWGRYVRPTLVTRAGRAIFPTTPDISGAWLYDIEMEWENGKKPDWEVFACPAWECPHIPQEEIESQRRDLPEDAFMEQVGGEWIFYVGRVFKPYQPSIHIIEPFDIPKDWKLYEGIDYGISKATAVMFIYKTPTGDYYVADEYYETDKPTPTHAQNVLHIESRHRRPTVRVADHHALGRQLMLDWSLCGVPSINVECSVMTRRDRLMSLLECKEVSEPYHVREFKREREKHELYPRLFIFKGKCPNLQKELLYLKWKETQRREGTFGDTIGEDHAIDALSYPIVYSYTASSWGRKTPPGYRSRKIQPSITGY